MIHLFCTLIEAQCYIVDAKDSEIEYLEVHDLSKYCINIYTFTPAKIRVLFDICNNSKLFFLWKKRRKLKDVLELHGVVPRDKEMVVGNRVGEQVRDDVTSLEPYLRAAEIGPVLVAREQDIFGKDARQVAVHLYQCVVA